MMFDIDADWHDADWPKVKGDKAWGIPPGYHPDFEPTASLFYGLYDPNQPRDPAGSATGGQWSGEAGAAMPADATYDDWKHASLADRVASLEKQAESGAMFYKGRGVMANMTFTQDGSLPVTHSEVVRFLKDDLAIPNGQRFLDETVAMATAIGGPGGDLKHVTINVRINKEEIRRYPSTIPTLALEVKSQGVTLRRLFSRQLYEHIKDYETRVDHDLFTIEQGYQGKGDGARMLADSLDIYRAHGIERIDTQANIDVGSYAWGKLGFKAVAPDTFADVMRSRAKGLGLFKGPMDKNTGRKPHDPDAERAFERQLRSLGEDAPAWLASQPKGKEIMANSSWYAYLNVRGKSGRDVSARLKTKLAEIKKQVKKS